MTYRRRPEPLVGHVHPSEEGMGSGTCASCQSRATQYDRLMCPVCRKRLGLTNDPPADVTPVQVFDARMDEMVRQRIGGMALAAIGKAHGVTRERVRQILRVVDWTRIPDLR